MPARKYPGARKAWSDLLVAGRDWHRHHRRLYTNQTMITDMEIYQSNRGLEVVDPANALSEAAVRCYLYEAVALEPWRDSDPGDGSHSWGMGTNYWQLTTKHLTKELGYVGYYGEVLDWVTSIYNATRPAPGLPGDEKIKSQLENIAAARAVFRYPGMDEDGNRAMLIEAVVGWRDPGHYPGNVAYGERSTWDASALYTAAATLDPDAVGYAQQMFEDGQFFISLERQMAQANNLRVTAGLLEVPDDYELVKTQVPDAKRLPMTPGQPDFIFSDEEDGVVAIKNGDETFYASLYWRARNAVNFLARVHFTTPTADHIGVVAEDVQFTPSEEYYARPDYINFGFANGGPKFPVELHSASAGEKLPIAKVPDGVRFRPGDESIYAGKGDFYTLRYGQYLIGMNLTTDRTFELKTPAGAGEVKELVSGRMVEPGTALQVTSTFHGGFVFRKMSAPIQHDFLAIDEGHATLLHINERDQSTNWIVPIGQPAARDMQLIGHGRVLIGHHHGYSEFDIALGRVVKEFNTLAGVTAVRRQPDGQHHRRGCGYSGRERRRGNGTGRGRPGSAAHYFSGRLCPAHPPNGAGDVSDVLQRPHPGRFAGWNLFARVSR